MLPYYIYLACCCGLWRSISFTAGYFTWSPQQDIHLLYLYIFCYMVNIIRHLWIVKDLFSLLFQPLAWGWLCTLYIVCLCHPQQHLWCLLGQLVATWHMIWSITTFITVCHQQHILNHSKDTMSDIILKTSKKVLEFPPRCGIIHSIPWLRGKLVALQTWFAGMCIVQSYTNITRISKMTDLLRKGHFLPV